MYVLFTIENIVHVCMFFCLFSIYRVARYGTRGMISGGGGTVAGFEVGVAGFTRFWCEGGARFLGEGLFTVDWVFLWIERVDLHQCSGKLKT